MTELHRQLFQAFDQYKSHAAIESKAVNRITYGQLAANVSELIAKIAACSKSNNIVLGILSTRCAEAYIGVLAAFFSGVRFVPLNPGLPISRLNQVVSAGKIDIVVFDTANAKVASELEVESLLVAIDRSVSEAPKSLKNENFDCGEMDIAYQMFTSGSTGKPKGVPISYGSLVHYVTEIKKEIEFPPYSRYSQLFDLSFDLSMHDIFVTLSSGGTLVPASSLDLMMPHDYIRKKEIDIWFSVPMLSVIAVRGQANKAVEHQLTTALFCGEALVTDYAISFQRFLGDTSNIYNLYGPTEATIAFTIKKLDEHDSIFSTVPLGTGFGKNNVAIDTKDGVVEALADGVQGELLLSGPQVFDGYKPDVAIDCFVQNDGHTYYRSGDNVEIISGQLIHKGRKDSQIKFRGYRIELGDIEATFRRLFDCSTAVAVLVGDGEKTEIVLAYDNAVPVEDFSSLDRDLPPYMIPARYVQLDNIPTNINGKVDRIAIKTLVESS